MLFIFAFILSKLEFSATSSGIISTSIVVVLSMYVTVNVFFPRDLLSNPSTLTRADFKSISSLVLSL